MGCLNCNTELNHTIGKRKKQFCSPDCRVRYWQKNKPKKESEIDPLSNLIDVRKEQDAFCEKRGWKTEQLLSKIEEYDRRIKYYAESKSELEQAYGELVEQTQNKADNAPEPAKGLLGLLKSDPGDKGLKSTPSEQSAKPKELSPFLKSLQASKNNQK